MPRFSFASVRARLISLVFLCLLPALGLTLYNNLEQRRLEMAQARENVLRLTRMVAAREERLIEGVRQLLIAFAQLPQVRDGDRAACSRLFSVKERKFTVSNYYTGRISGKPGVALGYPVLDATGEIQSVVYTWLDLAWFNQLMAEVQLPEGAVLYMIDRDGTIIACYPDPEKWVGKVVPDAPILKAMLSEGEGVREVRGLDGVMRLYAFTPVSDVGEADVGKSAN